jgi:uncharacterized membrane protein YGL010W
LYDGDSGVAAATAAYHNDNANVSHHAITVAVVNVATAVVAAADVIVVVVRIVAVVL